MLANCSKVHLYHNKCALRTQSSPAVVRDLKPEKNQKLKLIFVEEQCIRSTTISLIDLCAVLAARYPSYVDLAVTCKPRAVVLITLLIGNRME